MKSMTAGRVVNLLLIALAATLVAGVASADVELFEGESATRATSRHRVVQGSVKAVSGNPGVATISKPTGDNAKVTITGVKEGKTTVKVTGRIVFFAVGANQKQLTTEKPFETSIDVTVKKAGASRGCDSRRGPCSRRSGCTAASAGRAGCWGVARGARGHPHIAAHHFYRH